MFGGKHKGIDPLRIGARYDLVNFVMKYHVFEHGEVLLENAEKERTHIFLHVVVIVVDYCFLLDQIRGYFVLTCDDGVSKCTHVVLSV